MFAMPRLCHLWPVALAIACLAKFPLPALGQAVHRDGFDGPEVSWQPAGNDARYRLDGHARDRAAPRRGDACETVQITAGNGSFVYFALPVGPARVIDELTVSLWVRADRFGPQLLGRVVLPHTIDPKDNKPAVILLRGTSYDRAGQWQELHLGELPKLVEREAQLLRTRLGSQVDLREAVLDGVVMNVFAGPGTTRVWLDDLEISALVGTDAAPVRWRSPDEARPGDSQPTAAIRRQGAQLLVAGRPFFPRALQYQGEPLELLKRLGFNAVQVSGLPPAEFLQEAQRLGLWIICRPPLPALAAAPADAAIPIGAQWNGVLAWDVGENLTRSQFDATRRQIEQLRAADPLAGRPVLCDALTDLRAYSRHVDVFRPTRLPLASSLELADFGVWLASRRELFRPGTPQWPVIQTQPPAVLVQQVKALGGDEPALAAASHEQVRLLAHLAISSGARGLLFESRTRLSQDDPASKYRAATLELINLELGLLEPWLTTGQLAGVVEGNSRTPSGGLAPRGGATPPSGVSPRSPQLASPGANPQLLAFLLQTETARLLLPLWRAPRAQLVMSQSADHEVTFVVPGVPDTNDAYEVSLVGLRPIEHKRVSGGVRLTLREFDLAVPIVLTQDARVISALTKSAAERRQRAAQLVRELAAYKAAAVEALDQKLAAAGRAFAQSRGWQLGARAYLQQCDAALARQRFEDAYLAAARAVRPLRIVERAHFERAVENLSSPLASPLALHSATLPRHVELMSRLRWAQWGNNLLPGGDCEDLPRMLDAGWRHFQHLQTGVRAEAELAGTVAHSGTASVHLRAFPDDPQAPLDVLESPPLWITTAPVSVQSGQLLRIHGWVKVPLPITASVDGLMIVDSLSGPLLAERIVEAPEWREFTLFRAAPQSGMMTVTFVLTGLGEAWLDDVTIEPVLLPGGLPTARR